MINGINHVTFAVSDIPRSFRFYSEVLGLKPILRWKNGAYFLAGETWLALNLDECAATSSKKDYSHLAFSCLKKDFNKQKEKILSSGSSEWSKNQSEGKSLYFTDPDGHRLELHVGDLASRLKAVRDNPPDEAEFFL
jgi:catechol 2,3-dioxygenase-like lactoylglutathione lyase family enzyme